MARSRRNVMQPLSRFSPSRWCARWSAAALVGKYSRPPTSDRAAVRWADPLRNTQRHCADQGGGRRGESLLSVAVSFAVVRREPTRRPSMAEHSSGEGLSTFSEPSSSTSYAARRAPGETAMGSAPSWWPMPVSPAFKQPIGFVRGLQLLFCRCFPRRSECVLCSRERPSVAAGLGPPGWRSVSAERDIPLCRGRRTEFSTTYRSISSAANPWPSWARRAAESRRWSDDPGFYPPSSGSILLDGKELAARSSFGAQPNGCGYSRAVSSCRAAFCSTSSERREK